MAKKRATGKPKGDLSSEEFIARQVSVFRRHENTLMNENRLTSAERREFRVSSRQIQDYYKNNPNSKTIQNFLNRGNRFASTKMLGGAPGQGMGGLGQGGRGGGGGSRLSGK